MRSSESDGIYYHSYLELDKILNAQKPITQAHDEHLFILIHQTYELWFKQVLHDLQSCISKFENSSLDDRDLLTIVTRMGRVNKILRILVEQFTVLETMTPMDFLDFRNYMFPASGFQSVQFRILENKLGLPLSKRLTYDQKEYTNVLNKEHSAIVEKVRKETNLFTVIEKWLERFPYLVVKRDGQREWCFWQEYESAVDRYIKEDRQFFSNRTAEFQEKRYKSNVDTFSEVFDQDTYQNHVRSGNVRLSYRAMKAALMIMLYRDEPLLQMPHRILQSVMDLDSLMTLWRNAHALMVHRMIGNKMGSGGSSGYQYVNAAAVHHKVFTDFFNLSTYMIPKTNLPVLPNQLKSKLAFPRSKL